MFWPGEVWHGICYCLVGYGIVYGMACWTLHSISYGLTMAWYMVWPVGHDIVYLVAWRGMAWYMVWPCGHGMVYGMAWQVLAWYMMWPAGHGMAYGMA